MTFKFLKKKPEMKKIDRHMVFAILFCSTYLISVILLIYQWNVNGERVDKFHRDIIGRCIDKNWSVSLYKDGQLESCRVPAKFYGD